MLKQLVRASDAVEALESESAAAMIAAMRVSPEGQEGLAAFLEKRAPSWKPQD
jgi:methylglutaconyl-CoA hydratase